MGALHAAPSKLAEPRILITPRNFASTSIRTLSWNLALLPSLNANALRKFYAVLSKCCRHVHIVCLQNADPNIRLLFSCEWQCIYERGAFLACSKSRTRILSSANNITFLEVLPSLTAPTYCIMAIAQATCFYRHFCVLQVPPYIPFLVLGEFGCSPLEVQKRDARFKTSFRSVISPKEHTTLFGTQWSHVWMFVGDTRCEHECHAAPAKIKFGEDLVSLGHVPIMIRQNVAALVNRAHPHPIFLIK